MKRSCSETACSVGGGDEVDGTREEVGGGGDRELLCAFCEGGGEVAEFSIARSRFWVSMMR